MSQTQPSKPRPASPSRATMLGLGLVALTVIALIVIVVISTNNPTSGSGTAAANPTNADSSDNSTPILDPRFGNVPIPISPTDNTVLSSLDPITFTWQRVSNIEAHYNLQLQYSDDGSTWQHTETVLDLLSPKYERRTPFLAAKLIRWRVWATVNKQDGDASDWFTIQLPSK